MTKLEAKRDAVIWHDVECGAYGADLPLWEQLAASANGPVLELGCGTGRVTLHLARRGFEVTGVDSDPALVAELARRAAEEALSAEAEVAEASELDLGRRFGLIVAPMQLLQLLPGEEVRQRCLAAAEGHLRTGGLLAAAIVESAATGSPPSPALPDVRESDGWVYSSLPLGVRREDQALVVGRLRQAVAPDGELRESRDEVRLQLVTAAQLEAEGREAGLRPAGRRRIAATDDHVGSTVVLLEG